MLIENEFSVAAPIDFLWGYLLDVERIAPCMPGAELTEVVDDHTWKGKLVMKFGPVGMSFAGTVTMQERDDAGHRVILAAKGMEAKGKGAANAKVTSWLEAGEGDRTSVHMQADISLTGAAAQLSRGLMPEVSKKLTQQFADCLEQSMGAARAEGGSKVAEAGEPTGDAATSGDGNGGAARADGAAASAGQETSPSGSPSAPSGSAPASRPVAAKPVGGLRLGLSALGALIANFFRGLFSGGSKSS